MVKGLRMFGLAVVLAIAIVVVLVPIFQQQRAKAWCNQTGEWNETLKVCVLH